MPKWFWKWLWRWSYRLGVRILGEDGANRFVIDACMEKGVPARGIFKSLRYARIYGLRQHGLCPTKKKA